MILLRTIRHCTSYQTGITVYGVQALCYTKKKTFSTPASATHVGRRNELSCVD